MSSRQTAVINGLLAENVGKNDLVRHAEAQSRNAQSRANDAEHSARMSDIEAQELAYEVRRLKKELATKEQEVVVAQAKNAAFKQLLSRPMREIAELSGDFKATYEVQQQMLAEWILAQRAYKETATSLGLQLGKSPEEVQQLATQNANAVLENRTQHGNDSTTSPLLNEHAATILAIRKKNGKA